MMYYNETRQATECAACLIKKYGFNVILQESF